MTQARTSLSTVPEKDDGEFILGTGNIEDGANVRVVCGLEGLSGE